MLEQAGVYMGTHLYAKNGAVEHAAIHAPDGVVGSGGSVKLDSSLAAIQSGCKCQLHPGTNIAAV